MGTNILVCVEKVVGGEYIATSRLFKAFKKQNKKINIIYLQDYKPKKYKLLNFIFQIFASLLNARKQINYINKKKPLKYVFSTSYVTSLAAATIIVRDFKVVHMFHGTKAGFFQSFIDLNYRMVVVKILENIAYFCVDKITVPSVAAKIYINKNTLYLCGNKIVILKNIVSEDFFAPSVYNSKSKIILYSGRMAENKGIEQLALAFTKIKEDDPDFKLLYLYPSEGVNNKIFRSVKSIIRAYDLTKSCTFLKDPSFNQIVSAYKKSRLMVLASSIEFAPLSVVEAFATGLPVIGTDVGNVGELLSMIDCRLVIKSASTHDIYSTSKYFLGLSLLESRKISELQKNIATEYTEQKVLDIFNQEFKF